MVYEWETLNVQLVRYEKTQESARSVMPMDKRICNRRARSIVSKAEDRTRKSAE